MSIRFRKSIKLMPGVRVNFGAKSGSLTVGPRGGSVSFGSRGVYSNVGIPGSGISYRSKIGGGSASNVSSSRAYSGQAQNKRYVEMKIALSLQEDGTIIFRDENNNLLDDNYVAQAKRQNREFIFNWLEENCVEINQKISDLINIHFTTPSPDTEITFTPVPYEVIPPVEPSSIFPEPMPTPPIPKPYGFLAKRIKFFRNQVDKRNLKKQIGFQNATIRWHEHKRAFEVDFAEKISEYQKNLSDYQNAKNIFDGEQEKRRKFIEEDRLNDQLAMQEFLTESLESIVWPRETNISFEVSTDGRQVMLDVDLPEIEDMPTQQATVSKKEFRILYKDISETQSRINYYTHIHAIGFRILGEVLMALPTINAVVLSAYSQRTDKKTGKIVDEYLYSIKVTRNKWESIDFNNLKAIDVAECFALFELKRKATKTGVITPIEPFSA